MSSSDFHPWVEKTILALDLPVGSSGDLQRELARYQTIPLAGVKIGLQVFTRLGPSAVEIALDQGFRVFLDLKFHDIPNTMARACESAAQLGIWMLTVHAMAGTQALAGCAKALKERLADGNRASSEIPKMLGVTVLTSEALSEPGEVVRRAEMAVQAGCNGVIASAQEARHLRSLLGPNALIVTPGIRLQGGATQDQKRVATPDKALADGADFLVIGRPILEMQDLSALRRSGPRSS